MKKVLSLVLCLLMVFGSFAGAFAASAEETNLWTDMTAEDFGTLDTNGCPISGYEEGTNTYGKKFTVKGAYYTSFYIEMPELETNSTYNLSFKYDNHIIESNAGSIRSVSVVTEEEMAKITDADGTILPSTITVLGSSLALDKGQYTDLSGAFTTRAVKTKHYLYFVTDYAYWLYLCDFKLVKTGTVQPDTNVLSNTTAADWGAKSWSSVANSNVTCEGGNGLLVSHAMHQKIFTVTELEPNTAYDFSFNWKAILGTTHGSAAYPSEIYVYPTSRTGDIMNAERESGASANSGKWDTNSVFHPVSGELTDEDNLLTKAIDRATNKTVALSADWAYLSTEFVTSDDTEYAILIHFNCNGANDSNKIHLSDFNLSKTVLYDVTVDGGTADKSSAKEGDTVTLTATPTATQEFSYWEIAPENVELSDATNETATFTMPAEAVSVKAVYTENLWGTIDTTWFGTVDQSLTSGFGFTDYTNDTYNDAKAVNKCWHSTFYIKLPSNLKTNTNYELTFNYDNSIQTTASKITRIDIVTEDGLKTADSDGYGTTVFKNLTTNLALDKGGWTEFTADFKTGDSDTEYYLYFTLGYCYTLRLGGFEFKEITKNPITVENGTANVVAAKEGAEVTLTANTPAEGMAFDRWDVISGNVTLADPYSATTTFAMSNEAVSVKAVYKEYGAQVVYVKPDGTPYADAANLNPAKIETAENIDGTSTLTLNYDVMDDINSFLGWYKDDILIESGLSYTYNPEDTNLLDITAKILCRNVLTGAASFESYANGTNMRVEPIATGVAPYDDKWGLVVGSGYETENIGFYLKTMGDTSTTYYTDIGYDRETGTYYPEADRKTAKYSATPHSGNSMLALSSSYRSFVRKIEGLKPNTDYTMSMYVMNPDEYNFLSSVTIASTYNIKPSYLSVMSNRFIANSQKIAGTNIYGFYEEPRNEELFETNVTIKDKSSVQNWKKISFSFKTDDNTDSVYIHLYPRNRNTWYNRCQTYVDDMVCYETAINYTGNAMRAASSEVPQALRYKFSVKNEMLISYNGSSFKELGILAADSTKLNGKTLYKGDGLAKDVKVSEDNYQYVDGDNENTYFTAALYNIGRSGGKIDYNKFATKYAVRPYFVYEDENGLETIIYGETVNVSVFDVMYAIRDWPKTTEDLNIVNTMLENAAIRSHYSDWQPADGWNLDNPNAPTEYDYSFAVVGDIQYTTENYPEYLDYTFDWIINNKDSKNIQYVFNNGDITNMSSQTEFTAIDEQLLKLKEAGLNQTIIRGNHDKIAPYDANITADKYAYGGDKFESYDGTMKTYYRIVTVSGIKYMMLALDFFPSTAEVAWAREKIDANPDCNVIISTHGYLDDNMVLLQEDDVYDVEDRKDAEGNAVGGHAGQYIYDNLVFPCSNVVMVLCGHELSYGPEYNLLTREDGSTAHQFLINFQQSEYTDLRSYGMISMFYFSNGGKTVTVEWFSTIKNEYYMDKYQFTFDLNVIE
ncbi:MAG: metallophosphoesterase [Clostridia bacterium]|nr:metallophosphoesterase [Clostridia bacterium]